MGVQEAERADARVAAARLTDPAQVRLGRFAARRGMLIVGVTAAPSLWLTGRLLTRPGHPVVDGCAGAPADFCVFWGAARLAWQGRPLAAFDAEALAGVLAGASGTLDGGWFPFLHPPGALFLMAPLGALSAPLAWLVFSALSLVAVALALRRLTDGIAPIWLDAVLAPALLPALILGQLTLLWLAGFIAAFLALRDGRAVVAGLLIGLLTLKPTLGLLLPVALIACGAWRVILVAALTALLVQGGPTLLYGAEYWRALAAVYAAHSAHLLAALPDLRMMASLPAGLAWAGIPTAAALTAQSLLTLGLALGVVLIWRRKTRSFDRRMAVLAAAVPLATPYLWYYDAGMTLVAGLFLLRAGLLAQRGLLVWLALWMGPGLMLWFGLVAPGLGVTAAAVLLPMALALLMALRPQRPGPPCADQDPFSSAPDGHRC